MSVVAPFHHRLSLFNPSIVELQEMSMLASSIISLSVSDLFK